NPRILSARSRSRAADEGVPQARAGYFPSVTGHADAGLTADPRHPVLSSARSNQSIGYDIMLSQPIFDSGRAASSVAVAKASAAAEQEAALMVEQETTFAGISAYTEVLASRRLLRINERAAALLDQTAKSVRMQLALHEATQADLAQAQAALAGAV